MTHTPAQAARHCVRLMYVLPFDEQVYEHVPVATSSTESCGGKGSRLVPTDAAAIIMAAATIHLVI
jgi:hypothetical protein